MDDNPNCYRIPKRINDPLLLWIFPMTHVMPGFFCILMTVFMGHFLFFMGVAVGWYMLISHIELHYSRGHLLHTMYWLGLTKQFIPETKTVPDGMKREFIQ